MTRREDEEKLRRKAQAILMMRRRDRNIQRGGVGVGVDPSALIAANHIAAVQSDSGTIESEAITNYVIGQMVSAFGISSEDAFKTRFPVTIDPCTFGYKPGTGSLSTLGFVAEKMYSVNSSGNVVQATAASQPLLLRQNDIDGNYAYFPRSTSTINQALRRASGITFTPASDTLVITAKILMTNQTATSYDIIVFTGTQWLLQYKNSSTTKTFRLAGTTAVADATGYTPSTTVPHCIRVTATPTTVSYEWSANGISWTTLDSGLTPPTYGTASTISIGYSNGRTQNAGNIYYVKIENQTTATTVECNLNDFDPEVSETQFVTAGSTWLLDYGANTTGLKMSLVNRTLLQGDGIAHKLSASLNFTQPHTVYALIKRHGTGTIYGMAASSSLSNDATNTTLNNGSALSKANSSRNKQLLTIESNGSSSKIRVDNGSDTSGDGGANNGTYLDVFANASAYGNYELFALIVSSQADSEAQKTAMYNLLMGN